MQADGRREGGWGLLRVHHIHQSVRQVDWLANMEAFQFHITQFDLSRAGDTAASWGAVLWLGEGWGIDGNWMTAGTTVQHSVRGHPAASSMEWHP